MKKPVILMILDGFGIAPEKGNAIKAAKKPNIDKLFASNPLTQIGASGMDVGLPDGQMGNSEVGHTNMGAGRIVYQELTRITKAIQDGDFFDTSGNQGCFRIIAIAKSIADTCAKCDDVFQCTADFDTDHIRIRIDANIII